MNLSDVYLYFPPGLFLSGVTGIMIVCILWLKSTFFSNKDNNAANNNNPNTMKNTSSSKLGGRLSSHSLVSDLFSITNSILSRHLSSAGDILRTFSFNNNNNLNNNNPNSTNNNTQNSNNPNNTNNKTEPSIGFESIILNEVAPDVLKQWSIQLDNNLLNLKQEIPNDYMGMMNGPNILKLINSYQNSGSDLTEKYKFVCLRIFLKDQNQHHHYSDNNDNQFDEDFDIHNDSTHTRDSNQYTYNYQQDSYFQSNPNKRYYPHIQNHNDNTIALIFLTVVRNYDVSGSVPKLFQFINNKIIDWFHTPNIFQLRIGLIGFHYPFQSSIFIIRNPTKIAKQLNFQINSSKSENQHYSHNYLCEVAVNRLLLAEIQFWNKSQSALDKCDLLLSFSKVHFPLAKAIDENTRSYYKSWVPIPLPESYCVDLRESIANKLNWNKYLAALRKQNKRVREGPFDKANGTRTILNNWTQQDSQRIIDFHYNVANKRELLDSTPTMFQPHLSFVEALRELSNNTASNTNSNSNSKSNSTKNSPKLNGFSKNHHSNSKTNEEEANSVHHYNDKEIVNLIEEYSDQHNHPDIPILTDPYDMGKLL